MSNRLYVGNLAFSATQDQINEHFSAVGDVVSVSVMTDRETGQPRGFAFVEMASADAAQKAISELNGRELAGRALRIDIAEERRGGGGGGGGGGGRGGRGGGGGRGGRDGGYGGGGGGRGGRY